MQYRLLGRSGLVVSRLAFGAMTFTAGNRINPALYRTEAGEADRLVGMALDAGVTFFDTADVYAGGESEAMLGRALGARRKDVVLATKVGGRTGEGLNEAGLSRGRIMAAVDASLARLGTDWIDVYIVHRFDPLTPIEETLRALDDIVRAGKVRYLGFSNWPAWGAAAAMELARAHGLAPFTHGQMYYSLAGRDIEHDYLDMAARYGLGLSVWSPLSGGLLTGKYRGGDGDGRLATFDMMPIDRSRIDALLDTIIAIAGDRAASPAQVALGWLLSRPAVTSIILGASKAVQLADTLGAVDLALEAEELARLDAVSATEAPYPGWFLQRYGDTVLAAALANLPSS
ncbi:aldo/keto reductase [Flavisphingomonas formosensis]|uniref:aldo/keto reductase n=1 Tax=Flavisphingomonas formosensis TaxID=861534 RepID=UPI0012F902F6|nr:aldo/keto reductase [Sphingomonas formosensis]